MPQQRQVRVFLLQAQEGGGGVVGAAVIDHDESADAGLRASGGTRAEDLFYGRAGVVAGIRMKTLSITGS